MAHTELEAVLYVLEAGHWQPRPDGWYEKSVTHWFSTEGVDGRMRLYSYTVDGRGYGSR
jgi:hypothetical protein